MVSLHFVFVTLTTVGFGDVSPATGVGRVSVSILIFLGITIFTNSVEGYFEWLAFETQRKYQHQVFNTGLTSADSWRFFDEECSGKISREKFTLKMLLILGVADTEL